MTDTAHCRGIPTGITFGSKVLVVPGIASELTHSGDFQREHDNSDSYRWIRRGDPITEFCIEGSRASSGLMRAFTNQPHTAQVRSPASGLILHTGLDATMSHHLTNLQQNSSAYWATFAILLPDDEPPAEGPDYIYGPLCNLVREFSHYYLKPSRRRSMGPFSEEKLSSLLSLQRQVGSRVFDVLPRWSDYLNEARTRHPCLRPYIKHLQQV